MPLPLHHQWCLWCVWIVFSTEHIYHHAWFCHGLTSPAITCFSFFCIFFYLFDSAFLLSFLMYPFKLFLFKILIYFIVFPWCHLLPSSPCFLHNPFPIRSISDLQCLSLFLYSPSSSHLVFFPHLISWPSQSHPFLHHFLHMKSVLPDFLCTLLPVILSFFLFLSPFFHFHPCDSVLPYPFQLFCILACPPSLVSYPPRIILPSPATSSRASFSLHPPLHYSSLSQLTALWAWLSPFFSLSIFILFSPSSSSSSPRSLSTSVFYPFLHWWNGLTVWRRLIELPHKHSFSHIPSLDSPPFEGDVLWGFVCCTAVWQFDTHIHT